jgi:hypothetical protein
MFKPNFFSLVSTSCLMSFVLLYSLGSFHKALAAGGSIRLTTDPSTDRISPFEAEATKKQSPVNFELQAMDSRGQPLKNASIDIRVVNPSANPWFRTDFPIVEGTDLLKFVTDAPDGKVRWQQMMPIRGNYQIIADVKPTKSNSFRPFVQSTSVSVSENSIKYQNFALLAVLLLVTGGVGGWIVGSRQPIIEGEVAPRKVRVLLSGAALVAIAALLYVNVSAEQAQSGMSEPMSHMQHGSKAGATAAPMSAQVAKEGLMVKLSGDGAAIVGKPANFQIQVTDAVTNQPVSAAISVKEVQLEHDWTSFAFQTNSTNGLMNWQSGLFDGAPHRLDVVVSPAGGGKQFPPIKIQQEIEVAGVAPPLITRLISLSYMTGIVASAFLVAFWWRRRQPVKQQLT